MTTETLTSTAPEFSKEIQRSNEAPLDLHDAINQLLRRDVERTATLLKENDDLQLLVNEFSEDIKNEYGHVLITDQVSEESMQDILRTKAEAFRDSGELKTMLELEGKELEEKAKRMGSLSKDPEKNKVWNVATNAVKKWIKLNATGLKITAGVTLALAAGAAALYFNPAMLGYPTTQLAKYWAMYGLPSLGAATEVAGEAVAVVTENAAVAGEVIAENTAATTEVANEIITGGTLTQAAQAAEAAAAAAEATGGAGNVDGLSEALEVLNNLKGK